MVVATLTGLAPVFLHIFLRFHFIQGPTALVLSGVVFKMQNLKPHPKLTESKVPGKLMAHSSSTAIVTLDWPC